MGYSPVAPETIRAYIEQQQCWICGKGGWKALSQHLVKKHGIPASQVREMAYMFKRERLISIELSEVISKDASRRFGNNRHYPVKGEPSKRLYSSKARDILRRRVNVIRPLGALAQVKRREPHSCPVCGTVIGTSRPIHCSPECVHIAMSEAASKAMTPERIALFTTNRRTPTPAEQSKRSKDYWRRFKELPLEEQRRLNLARAASRRVRVIKHCAICDGPFEVIPSQAHKAITCGKPDCKRQNKSNKGTGRKHTPASIAKMSAHAQQRHINEPLFGRVKGAA